MIRNIATEIRQAPGNAMMTAEQLTAVINEIGSSQEITADERAFADKLWREIELYRVE